MLERFSVTALDRYNWLELSPKEARILQGSLMEVFLKRILRSFVDHGDLDKIQIYFDGKTKTSLKHLPKTLSEPIYTFLTKAYGSSALDEYGIQVVDKRPTYSEKKVEEARKMWLAVHDEIDEDEFAIFIRQISARVICSICKTNIVNICFPCKHTLCGECVSALHSHSSSAKCPFCKKPLVEPRVFIL